MNFTLLDQEEITKLLAQNEQMLIQQQAICDQLREILDNIERNPQAYADQVKQRKEWEYFIQCQASCERIERRICDWFEGNWYRFSPFFQELREFDRRVIHGTKNDGQVSMQRQIIIYFIEKNSGLTREQIREYFDFPNVSNIAIAIKSVFDLQKDRYYQAIIERIENII